MSLKDNEFSVGDIVVYDNRVYIVVGAPEILIREAEVSESEALEFWIQTKDVRHFDLVSRPMIQDNECIGDFVESY